MIFRTNYALRGRARHLVALIVAVAAVGAGPLARAEDDPDGERDSPPAEESFGDSEDAADPESVEEGASDGASVEPAPSTACAEGRWLLLALGHSAVAQATSLVATGCPTEDVRDTHFLAGRLCLAARDEACALRELRAASEAHAIAPSALGDVLAFDFARALALSGEAEPAAEALKLLTPVIDDRHSGLRAEAARLAAELHERLGQHDEARRTYETLLNKWPEAPCAEQVRLKLGLLEPQETTLRDLAWTTDLHASVMRTRNFPSPLADIYLASVGTTGAVEVAGPDGDNGTRVDVALIDTLIKARRFDDARGLLRPWLTLVHSEDADEQRQGLDALEREADIAWEQHRFDDYLAALGALKKRGRASSKSRYREAHALALDGQFDAGYKLMRRSGRKSETHDFLFEFGRCEEAVALLHGSKPKKSRRKKKGDEDDIPFKAPKDERVALCLIDLGRGLEAAAYWESTGKSRKRGRDALHERYWFARALAAGGQTRRAKIYYKLIITDDPVDYYGHVAYSRLAELEGTVPAPETAHSPNITWRNIDPSAFRPTIHWTEASLNGAFDKAPRAIERPALESVAAKIASRWGKTLKAFARAEAFVRLGDTTSAITELHVAEVDLRIVRRSSRRLVSRARSELLDNRRKPRAPGGLELDEGGRYDLSEASAVSKHRVDIKHDVRRLQEALGDPWALRKGVFERERTGRLETVERPLAERLYPMAYADIVEPVTRQFGLPPYYVYAIMATESAFYPSAVSVANAYGLVQVIPSTGRHLARELGYFDFSPERLLDPATSVYFGSYYLARLLNRFRGQELLAAAGYNAGPHRVTKWLMARGHLPLDIFVEWIPYTQARRYSKRIAEHVGSYRRVYHDEAHIYLRNAIVTELGEGPNY